MRLQSGDAVDWTDRQPDRDHLTKDFGPGPFTVLGVEDGAPEDGQWVSLKRTSDGLAWISHRSRWESPKAERPGMFKAIPPTFHSHWLKRVTPSE